ncbi:hypothetical protein TTHERM_00196180 (macronuclear) [Tetrahymena thermophila SB210]|uniref:Uncharacterized protein n=1 Tax=Tetrahymena thermophila (strain SB210) TaxID=312017 RepID=Q23K16_TETTS|nr:hypothetical protein TTHERM_00196180 [Tetrahymena thermophila SB210]EAR97027.4 hypothetical protein TTHERM_00196180 [Tetrahymena thermophila SB210]|eukprot:XP_001017272.4 hypothetical protein TTHERM_00196180 [Tetrahymena thermophila SB210]
MIKKQDIMEQKQTNLKARLDLKEIKNVEESEDRYILNNYKLKKKKITKPGQKLNEFENINDQQNLSIHSNSKIGQDNKTQRQVSHLIDNSFDSRQQSCTNNSFYNSQKFHHLHPKKSPQKNYLKADSQYNRYINQQSKLDIPKSEVQYTNELNKKKYEINQETDKENNQFYKYQIKGFSRQKNNLFVKEKNKGFYEQKKFSSQNNNLQSQHFFKKNHLGSFYKKRSFCSQNGNDEQSFESLSISDPKSNNYDEDIKIKQKKGAFIGSGQSKQIFLVNEEKQANKYEKLNNKLEKIEIKPQNKILNEDGQLNVGKQLQEQFDQIRSSLKQNEVISQTIAEKQTSVSNLLNSFRSLKEILNYFYSYQNVNKISREVFEKVYLLNLKQKETNVIPIEIKTNSCNIVVINQGEAVKIDLPKVLSFQNCMLDPRKKNIKSNYK